MEPRRALRGLIVSALLSAFVYALLAGVGDARAIASALGSFPIPTLAAMVALTVGCYLIRATRWRYLVRLMGRDLSIRDATYIQFSGMTMTVTPGKVGEVLKALLARTIAGLPLPRGVALVFSERLTDVVAVTALSAGAVGAFSNSGPALAVAVLALVAGIALLSSERFHHLALTVASRQSWMRKHRESADAMSETVRATLGPGPLAMSVLLAAAAWSCEGLAFAISIRALGFDELSIPVSIAIYAISTLVGALTFLPGGIGLTEASLAGLLITSGMAAGGASAATLLIRLVTLWLGVGLGWVVLASRPALMRALMQSEP